MEKLSSTIVFQNKKAAELKNNLDFFLIKNPVTETVHMQIVPTKDLQKKSKLLAQYFEDEESLKLIYNQDYNKLKRKETNILFIWLGVLIVSSVVLGVTFNYIEKSTLSIFPLISLLLATISICIIILKIQKKT